jgi:HNH endonuclease
VAKKSSWKAQHGYLWLTIGKDSKGKDVQESAHRLVLWAYVGPPPVLGKYEALHLCGNKMCVNPTHLVWGTHKQNMQQDYAALCVDRLRWLQQGPATLCLLVPGSGCCDMCKAA